MEASERDSTQDWVLSPEATPPRIGELVARIDRAVEAAQSSEAAVTVVGEAAIKAAERSRDAVVQAGRAAEQAQRSAELAERASATVLEMKDPAPSNGSARPSDSAAEAAASADPTGGEDSPRDSLERFTLRADRVVARLQALERLPA
jgi:hypothetical protein